jgi:hypothetical protein
MAELVYRCFGQVNDGLTLSGKADCGAGGDGQENRQGGVLEDDRRQCQGGDVGGHIGGS